MQHYENTPLMNQLSCSHTIRLDEKLESRAVARIPRDAAIIKIFAVGFKRHVHFETEGIVTVQGNPRSLRSVAIEDADATSY